MAIFVCPGFPVVDDQSAVGAHPQVAFVFDDGVDIPDIFLQVLCRVIRDEEVAVRRVQVDTAAISADPDVLGQVLIQGDNGVFA